MAHKMLEVKRHYGHITGASTDPTWSQVHPSIKLLPQQGNLQPPHENKEENSYKTAKLGRLGGSVG